MVGFELEDLLTGEVGTLASVDGEGPRLGKYRINLCDLEAVGAGAIERAIREADLVVVDEVGPMELFSDHFVRAAEKALESDKPMLVVVHAKSRHPLAKKIRGEFALFVITEKNRDDLAEEIAPLLASLF